MQSYVDPAVAHSSASMRCDCCYSTATRGNMRIVASAVNPWRCVRTPIVVLYHFAPWRCAPLPYNPYHWHVAIREYPIFRMDHSTGLPQRQRRHHHPKSTGLSHRPRAGYAPVGAHARRWCGRARICSRRCRASSHVRRRRWRGIATRSTAESRA